MTELPEPPVNARADRSAGMIGRRALGASGLVVGEIGLGCLSMSWAYGDSTARDDRQSIRVIHRAHDLGVTLLDTADTYGPFINEELVGRAIKGRRENWCVTTKGGLVVHDDSFGMHRDGRPEHLRTALEASLRRLDSEYVDLYILHRIDRQVPLEDSWGTMAQFVAEGTARAIGLSQPTVEQARLAHAIHPVAAVQSEFSLWTQEPLADVMPWCADNGVAFAAFAPLGQGFLTGTVTHVSRDDFRSANPRFDEDNLRANQSILHCIDEVAERHGATRAQIAIAYVLACGRNVIPIPGTKQTKYLEENIGASAVALSVEDMARLRSAPPPAE